MPEIKIGWAQANITPDRPVFNGGQIYPRVSKYVHDPLTTTALALDNGEYQAILLSMDYTSPVPEVLQLVREKLACLKDFDPKNLSMHTTHTHNACYAEPYLYPRSALDVLGEEKIGLPEIPDNILRGRELIEFLADRLADAAIRAWNGRKKGGISTAGDYAVVAFNRRPVFEKDGKFEAKMYGVASQNSFVRYEGGSDHSADMIYTWDENNNLTGVAVCIPCPSQVFELHSFVTADYWHYTRMALREKLGNIFILPLCGAAGDQNPLDLTRISKCNVHELEEWGAQAGEVFRNFDMADECRGIADRITDAVLRGLRKGRTIVEREPVFRHESRSVTLPIRQVSEADYLEAKAQVEAISARFSPENKMQGKDMVEAFEPMGIIGRYVQQNANPTVEAPMHFWRIGDTAMCSFPFELFVEYSLRVKARAVSPKTVVVQLTDSSLGYLPTQAAINGGSYSSKPASTTCGPDSGDQLVEEALNAISGLWQ